MLNSSDSSRPSGPPTGLPAGLSPGRPVPVSPYAIERPETYVPRPVPVLPPKPPVPTTNEIAAEIAEKEAEKEAAQEAEKAARANRGPRPAYPSDISDAQWERVQPLVHRQSGRGRRPTVSLREVIDALHYRWTTGCAWRMLPHDFPPWNTVYFYYRSWRKAGVLPRLQAMLIERPTVDETAHPPRDARKSA